MAKKKGTKGKNTLNGTSGADTLLGLGGNDKLNGKAGKDKLDGGSGNDLLTGGAGNDVIKGGSGTDTAVYTGAWKNYTITQSGAVFVVADTRVGSPDGTDTVTSVEKFKFANGTFVAAQILNDAPVPNGDTGFAMSEDTNLTLTAAQLLSNDTDADAALGDTLTLQSVQGAVGGSVAIVSGNAVFTPTANFNGAASFTYTIADAKGSTATATASLTVNAVDDPIIYSGPPGPITGQTAVGTSVVALANFQSYFSDVDGPTITYSISGSSGELLISGNDLVYTPLDTGTDSFVLNATGSGSVAVAFSMSGLTNLAPTIFNLVITETTISFIATDTDTATISLGSAFAAAFGNPTINNGTTTTLNVAEQATAISATLQVTDGFNTTDVIGLFLGTSAADTENRSATSAPAALFGFGGNDILQGGTGADTFYGGGGTDTVSYANAAAGITIDNYFEIGPGGDKFAIDVERFEGSPHNDVFRTTLIDTHAWIGGGGNDTIELAKELADGNNTGLASVVVSLANATLGGGFGVFTGFSFSGISNFIISDLDAANDYIITGNDDANQLQGARNATPAANGFGGDTLDGKGGSDTLTGDPVPGDPLGNDRFVFNATTMGGTDTITDFEDSIDLIQLVGSQYGLLAGGSVAGILTVAAGTNGASMLHFDTSTNTLYSAVNGPQEAIANLQGFTGTFSAADFILV